MRMCWYCGSFGDLVVQSDGTLLHEECQAKAERDYPDRVFWETDQTDAPTAWQDARDLDDDVGI